MGHDASKCYKFHLELKPKTFLNNQEENKTNAIVQHNLGLDSRDETKIAATSFQGKSSFDFVVKDEPIINEKKRSELFHIRVIYNHTKIDTLFDSGSLIRILMAKRG